LKAIVADVKWSEGGIPRGSVQDAMTRFTSSLPFSYSLLPSVA
jgi:hypothetical protein